MPNDMHSATDRYHELYGWLQQPAIFVDNYSAALWPQAGVVRIAFGEALGGDVAPLYRLGIAMPVADARRLLQTLLRMFKQEDERQKLASMEVGELAH
jgi:hypothetical protein